MPRWGLLLHIVLDNLFQGHRVSIASCFAFCYRFAKDCGADEEISALDKGSEDTCFIRFDEPIGITDNFDVG
jgi:hypothetical protein